MPSDKTGLGLDGFNFQRVRRHVGGVTPILADDDEAWLSSQDSSRLEASGPLIQTVQNYEKKLIEASLAESNGKVAGPNGAAAKLGMPRSSLELKIKQLNIKKHPIR